MLNLLIREDRYKIRREYLTRLLNVFLFFIFVLSVSFLIFQNSLKVRADAEILSYQIQIQKDNTQEFLETQKEHLQKINDLENKYFLLKDVSNKNFNYIQQIQSVTSSGIKIEYLNFNSSDDETRIDVELRGVASTRDQLKNFSDRLVAIEIFSNVDVPVANLIQSEQSNFSIKFVIDNKK